MLQQTVVKTVIPYYRHFLQRWPQVADLAAADLDQVLHAWQGLGYYARARNLHKCAQTIVAEHGGTFPNSESELLKLPGIGPYTAAAIAAIAFGHKASPVDGNIERVMSRLFAVAEPLPQSKPKLRQLAVTLTPDQRAGDHAQALMDLGATVCLPRAPLCEHCPIDADCKALDEGIAADLPTRLPKSERPTRHGVAFCLFDDRGRLLFRRRSEDGLLGGMMEVPSTPWRDQAWSWEEAADYSPLAADWQELPGTVVHTFTHFRLELTVRTGSGRRKAMDDEVWQATKNLGDLALPSVMKKVLRHAL